MRDGSRWREFPIRVVRTWVFAFYLPSFFSFAFSFCGLEDWHFSLWFVWGRQREYIRLTKEFEASEGATLPSLKQVAEIKKNLASRKEYVMSEVSTSTSLFLFLSFPFHQEWFWREILIWFACDKLGGSICSSRQKRSFFQSISRESSITHPTRLCAIEQRPDPPRLGHRRSFLSLHSSPIELLTRRNRSRTNEESQREESSLQSKWY